MTNSINPTLLKYIQVIQALNPADGYMIVDLNLVYLAVSQSVIDAHGDQQMVGKTLSQLNSPLAAKVAYYRDSSQAIIASPHKTFRKIAKINIESEVILFDMQTIKIFDEGTGELVGLVSFFYKMSPNVEILKLLAMSGDEVYLDHPELPPLFTTDHSFNYRERCIIWLLTMGITRKEIAGIIAQIENRPLTENTITTIINRNIYPPLEVHNHSDFMRKVTASNLLSSIPQSLMQFLQNK